MRNILHNNWPYFLKISITCRTKAEKLFQIKGDQRHMTIKCNASSWKGFQTHKGYC